MSGENAVDQYLQVIVGERGWCIAVSNVREIINPVNDRRLVDQIIGGQSRYTIDDRDVPAVDLRRLFDETVVLSNDAGRVLLAYVDEFELALVVDSVERILRPAKDQVEPGTPAADEYNRDLISSTITWENHRYPVLSVADVYKLVREIR